MPDPSPEKISKLQPDRTVSLRGFDTFAAAAAVHSASPGGFAVSGTFRDPADFAVVVLYDADNFYEHPLIKYLPDFDFSGLILNFDVLYTDGVQPVDSPKYNWIDWATLDCIRADGSTAQVRLWDNSMLLGSFFPFAFATVNVETSAAGINANDRLTLWYENLAFDYFAPPGASTVTFSFFADVSPAPSISVNGTTYAPTGVALGDGSSAAQAAALISAINSAPDPWVTASAGASNEVILRVQPAKAGISFPVSASNPNGSATMLLTTPAIVASAIASEINGVNWIAANTTYALLASSSGAAVQLTVGRYGTVSVSGAVLTLTSGTVFSGLTPGLPILLNGAGYTVASVQSPTQLTVTLAPPAGSARYVAPRGGRDGNLIRMQATLSSPGSLWLDNTQIQFSGGSSSVTWRCMLDFTALGIDQLRQCWLTFAPSLVVGAYPATEWQAVFSNWQLSGAGKSSLTVAGPGSVRIEETDTACVYQPPMTQALTSSWQVESGFYSEYFANVTRDPGSSVTITYTCQFVHDLYVGTSLYSDRGAVAVTLDADNPTTLDCFLDTASAVVTRRLLRAGVAPGRHVAKLMVSRAGPFFFDFLEAAVPTDVPAALDPRTGISPALDFDTDHTYKLSPSRLLWILDKLGYAGPMNEYLGVFWWNERVLSGGSLASMQVEFSGTFANLDSIFLNLSGATLGKTFFTEDSPATVAQHFAASINGSLVGLWASANGAVLSIFSRSPAPAYNISLAASTSSANGRVGVSALTTQITLSGTFAAGDSILLTVNGTTLSQTMTAASAANLSAIAAWFASNAVMFAAVTITAAGSVLTVTSTSPSTPFVLSVWATSAHGLAAVTRAGEYGTWVVDDTASPPINRAVRDWHADFYAQCAARHREVVTACSMELVNPPAGYSAQFADGSEVATATGFGSLVSNHCAAGGSKMIAYQKAVYRHIAQMQVAAGLAPCVQYGEFLWWYFESANASMAYYDAETVAAARTALGRDLHPFAHPNDDPSINGGADAIFLRNRLRDHLAALVADLRAAYPGVICEILWPYDVNHPEPVQQQPPNGSLGGQLNRFVNLPVEWQLKTSSGFDRVKPEALAFGTTVRNLDLAQEAISLFPDFGWPVDSVRYLAPVFGSATPWNRELAMAIGSGLNINNVWALDHICLFNLDVPESPLERRSVVLTG